MLAVLKAANRRSANDWNQESWPLMLTAAKVWPLVSIISFVFVPVEKRVVFGGAIGVLWGIYLSLLQAER